MGCLKLTYQPTMQVLHTYELTPSREAKSVQSWLSVDPLWEDYPYQSPYTYCGWSPVMIIDPDGRGEDGSPYGVTNSGQIIKIGPDNPNQPDMLYAINNDGTKKDVEPIAIPNGTIKTTFTGTYKDWNNKMKRIEPVRFYGVLIKGDEISLKIAEFLYNNTYVEWTRVPIGEKEGANGWNVIITSRCTGSEGGATQIEKALLLMNYTIRGDDHNHPRNTPSPSKGDMSNAEMLEKKNSNVENRIYTKKDKKYHYYFSFGPCGTPATKSAKK
jgi:hypothetical protein